MKVEDVTIEVLSKAFRAMRLNAGLSQVELSARTKNLRTPLTREVATNQLSKYERGRALPSISTILSMLAACCSDGRTVSFFPLEQALESLTGVTSKPGLRSQLAELRRNVATVGDQVAEIERRIAKMEAGYGT